MTLLETDTDATSVYERKVRILQALEHECEEVTGRLIVVENELQPVLDTEAQLNLDLSQNPSNLLAEEELTKVEAQVKIMETRRDDAELELGELEDAITSIKNTLTVQQLADYNLL